MKTLRSVTTLALAITLASTAAHAQPAVTPRAAPAATPSASTERYGWKIAIVDALAVTAVLAGFAMFIDELDSDAPRPDEGPARTLAMLGGVTYAFGSAVIHAGHDNGGAALKSIGLRVGVPLASALVATKAADGESAGALIGVSLVMVSVIDIAVLAKRPARRRAAPFVAPTPHAGVTVGLVGSF